MVLPFSEMGNSGEGQYGGEGAEFLVHAEFEETEIHGGRHV